MKRHRHNRGPSGESSQKGFTLIEFVVIISIFAIMASVALVNFAGFRSNIGLNNLAHDIALTIRQAQVFGWATRSCNGTSGSCSTVNASGVVQLDAAGNPLRFADGVYFGQSSQGVFDREFVLYEKADASATENYVDNVDTKIDTVRIQGPDHVSAILGATDAGSLALSGNLIPTTAVSQVTTDFSVAFSRPRPEAMFFEGLAPSSAGSNYYGIYISADTDAPGVADHVIIISRFGEITVQ